MVEVAALVLAAGSATRFLSEGRDGGSKVFALLDGRPLLAHVVATAAASRVAAIIVVTGHGAERASGALAGLDVALVHNPDFADGMASSIGAGLAAVRRGVEAVLILLADMPLVTHATLEALIATFDRERPDAVVPTHHGRRGNPVLISRSLFPALMRLTGDEGARRILADGRSRVLTCEVDDPGVLVDVDTREALAALKRI